MTLNRTTSAAPSNTGPHLRRGFVPSEAFIAGAEYYVGAASYLWSVYSARGEARLHAGYDPGRGQRVGRVAALLQLRQDDGHAGRAPCQVLRASAEDPGPQGAGALSRLLRTSGRNPVARFRGSLPRVRGPRPAAAALFRARGPLPSRRSRRPVRVRRDLEGPRLSPWLLSALRRHSPARSPGSNLRRARPHAHRALQGAGGWGFEILALMRRGSGAPRSNLLLPFLRLIPGIILPVGEDYRGSRRIPARSRRPRRSPGSGRTRGRRRSRWW